MTRYLSEEEPTGKITITPEEAKLVLHKMTDEEALNELLAIAYEAETFIRSVVGYQDSAIANHLASAIEKVQGKKYLAIGRLAARVVYRNSKKAVEHSVQRTGFACDVDGCKKPGVVHLCEDHGLQ